LIFLFEFFLQVTLLPARLARRSALIMQLILPRDLLTGSFAQQVERYLLF